MRTWLLLVFTAGFGLALWSAADTLLTNFRLTDVHGPDYREAVAPFGTAAIVGLGAVIAVCVAGIVTCAVLAVAFLRES